METIINAVGNLLIFVVFFTIACLIQSIKDSKKRKLEEELQRKRLQQLKEEENYRRLVAYNTNLTTKF